MMNFLVLLIIVIAISKIFKNDKSREAEQQNRRTVEQPAQRRAERRTVEQPVQSRTARRTESPAAQTGANTYKKEDILSRSSKDVNEDFSEDTLKKQADQHHACVEGHYEQQKDLLKTVEDLMVLGPNCAISYERDFLAEGEKMLERYK